VRKKAYLFVAAAVLLVICAALYFSLRRSVERAVSTAEQERGGKGPGAELVSDVALPSVPSGRVRAVTRLLPVNDAVYWQGALVLATDGGLVIRRDSGATALTAVDGLPGTRIACLALWRDLLFAGADGGLAVIGRKRMRSYRFKNPRANKITCLQAGGNSVLIGTQGGGLIEYEGGEFRYSQAFTDEPELMVSALCPFEAGLAVGTWKSGVIVISGGQKTRLGGDQGLLEPVTALASQGGRLLIGSPLALMEWRRGQPVSVVRPDVYVSSITAAGEDVVVAALDQGVIRISGRSVKKEPLGWMVSKAAVLGQALTAMGERGLAAVDGPGGPPSLFPLETEALSENRLTAVAAGPEGGLWIGTFEHGVDVMGSDYALRANLTEPGFEAIDCIRPSAREGLMYVGTSRGVLIYSGARLTGKITKEDGLIGETVFDVLPLQNGGLAIATNRGITFRLSSGLESITAFNGLVNNHVYSLAPIGDIMAAGTLGGLSLVHGRRAQQSFTAAGSPLRHNWITALASGGGRLYVGTFGGGVSALTGDGKWLSSFSALGRLNVNQNAMIIADNKLVAGTFDSGLFVIDPETGEDRPWRGGLTSENVTGIAIWNTPSGRKVALATDCGLCVLEAEELLK